MRKPARPERTLTLRQRAEELLRKPELEIESTSPAELKVLLHELQVHQVELEIQNEELRNVQLELEESRDRYAELYDLAPMGYLTLDATGTIVKANLRAEALLGADRQDLVGARLSRFIGAESQDVWYLHLQRAMRGESRDTCEVGVRDGGRTLRAESVRHGDSLEPGQVFTVLFDISERKRMEQEIQRLNGELQARIDQRTAELIKSNEALRKSESRMRTILETAADAIVTIDESGIIVSFNQTAERMFGYAADEAIGLSFDALMGAADGERGGHPEDYLRARRSIRTEVRGLRKNGELFPAELAVSEFADGGRRFSAIITDISERRRLELEIAENSSAEQRRFAQDLHDGLCQELAGIGFMAGALEQKLRSQSSPEAPRMTQVVKLLGVATEKTRTLARGLFPVHLETAGLAAALHVLAEETEARHKVACRVNCAEGTDFADGNAATELYYIAREAINNAVKHGRAGTVVVTLTQHAGRITLKIEDDGVGLADKLEPDKGMGLRIMDYRARRIGALLTVRKRSAGGTIVTSTRAGSRKG